MNLETKPLGVIWVAGPYPVISLGLARILEEKARVHAGEQPPKNVTPSAIVLVLDEAEGLAKRIKRTREANPDVPILVFGMRLDLPLARDALKAGSRGFIHVEMMPEEILRAVEVAVLGGSLVAPRQLLEYVLLTGAAPTARSHALSARQREILTLVGENLSNAQIAKHLLLSESTVKQHLRGAYKILGVSNRTEAARHFRDARGA